MTNKLMSACTKWHTSSVITEQQSIFCDTTDLMNSNKKLEEYKSKYEKIWYVIDSINSMFGDPAPLAEIVNLLDRCKKLHLYVDD